MSKIRELFKSIEMGELRIDYFIKYREDNHTEEGHGFHTMYDMDIVEMKIIRILIVLPSIEIDITSKLNKHEIAEIENALTD